MLYQHVDMLQRNGIEATVLHEKKGRRLRWMKSELALTSKDLGSFEPQPNDVLVVPELWADNETLRRVNCRRLVFVQGSFLKESPSRQTKKKYHSGTTVIFASCVKMGEKMVKVRESGEQPFVTF